MSADVVLAFRDGFVILRARREPRIPDCPRGRGSAPRDLTAFLILIIEVIGVLTPDDRHRSLFSSPTAGDPAPEYGRMRLPRSPGPAEPVVPDDQSLFALCVVNGNRHGQSVGGSVLRIGEASTRRAHRRHDALVIGGDALWPST